MNKLADLGVEVVGISGDSVKTHELFKKAQKLNFTLLADEQGKVAKMFDVPFGKGGTVKTKDADAKPIEIERAGTAARWTFLIGKDGKIAYKNLKVIPAQDAKSITRVHRQDREEMSDDCKGRPMTLANPTRRTSLAKPIRDSGPVTALPWWHSVKGFALHFENGESQRFVP